MPIQTYFFDFFMLLIASSLVISGWFLATRGEEREMPDGTTKRTGNIFRGWYFFWTKLKPQKWVNYWYDEEHIVLFVRDVKPYLNTAFPDESWIKVSTELRGNIAAIVLSVSAVKRIPFIEREMGVTIECTKSSMAGSIEAAYTEAIVCKREPAYVFPAPIRKMMAECITCHASFYGSILFAGFNLLCDREYLSNFYGIFPSEYLTLGIIGTWICYTLSLSYTLTFLYKKL